MDGRIHSGDEIISVDGFSVLQTSHRQVVQLMNAAANRGQVVLVLRRHICHSSSLSTMQNVNDYLTPTGSLSPTVTLHNVRSYDVIVNRNENEGFGFVIISSVNKSGSTIGKDNYGS